MKIEDEIVHLIKKLDITSAIEQDRVWIKLQALRFDIPYYFLNIYPTFKKAQGRTFLLFRCIEYARTNEFAFQLGVKGLSDKALLVRYRAACILAYSLRPDAIPFLEQNLNHQDQVLISMDSLKTTNSDFIATSITETLFSLPLTEASPTI